MLKLTRNPNRFRQITLTLATLTLGLAATAAAAENTEFNETTGTAPGSSVWYLELAMNRDIDGDGIIGPPPGSALAGSSVWYLELAMNRDIDGDGIIGPPPSVVSHS